MGYFLQKYHREVGGHRLFVADISTVLKYRQKDQINVQLNLSAVFPGSCCSQSVSAVNGLTCCDSEHEKQRGHVVLMARDENAAFRGICVSFKANSLINKL